MSGFPNMNDPVKCLNSRIMLIGAPGVVPETVTGVRPGFCPQTQPPNSQVPAWLSSFLPLEGEVLPRWRFVRFWVSFQGLGFGLNKVDG